MTLKSIALMRRLVLRTTTIALVLGMAAWSVIFLVATASAAAQSLHDPACIRRCALKAHDACLNTRTRDGSCFHDYAVRCEKKCPYR